MKKFFLSGLAALAWALPAGAQEAAELKPGVQAEEPRVISPTPLADAELAFLKAASQEKDEDVLELALPQAQDWLQRNPLHPVAGEALLLQARLRYLLGDFKGALACLFRHFYEYPADPSSGAAQKLLQEILDREVDKKLKPALRQLAGAAEGADAAARLFSLLQKLPEAAGSYLYEQIAAENRAFLNRFPEREGNDQVRLADADLHLNMKQYLAARLGYEKVIRLHPASPLLARAKLFLAVVLADNLKEYDRAIAVFRDITATLPGTEQARAAYARLPALSERRKNYQLAVDVDEEIIARYPDAEEAYVAYLGEVRVLREKMDKFPEAVAVLNRVADKYKGRRAVEALWLAAEIGRGSMKAPAVELAAYDRLAAEYEDAPTAPKALHAAAAVWEKAKEYDKAMGYYRRILDKYPGDPLCKKASARVAAIGAGKP